MVESCPLCAGHHIIYDSKEVYCDSCGAVLVDKPLSSEPPRTFDHEDFMRKVHTGPPSSPHSDLGTSISRKGRSSRQTFRLFMQQQRYSSRQSYDYFYRRLLDVRRKISRVDLPKYIKREVLELYVRIYRKGGMRGRKTEDIIGALMAIVLRDKHSGYTFPEIAEMVGGNKKRICKFYKITKQKLHAQVPPSSSTDYLERFCSKLGLGPDVKSKAEEMLLDYHGEEPKKPQALAAAAIYKASKECGKRRAQTMIAKVADASEPIIRKYLKCLQR